MSKHKTAYEIQCLVSEGKWKEAETELDLYAGRKINRIIENLQKQFVYDEDRERIIFNDPIGNGYNIAEIDDILMCIRGSVY